MYSLPALSGPLLAPFKEVVPYGSFMVRSYVYTTAFYEDKNGKESFSYTNVLSQEQIYLGLTSFCDLSITPQFCFGFSKNGWSANFCDLPVGLDFQMLPPDYTPFFPGIKFSVKEIFPTGNYNHLKPSLAKQSRSGDGAFTTQFELVFYKLFHLFEKKYLSINCSGLYALSQPVNVFGFNSYGGGFGAQGHVLPGDLFKVFLSFEYTLTNNFAITLDNVYKYQGQSSFFGKNGISFQGVFNKTGSSSKEEFSMAPAIAYNKNRNLSIVTGVWLPLYRKNSEKFLSWIFNVQYTY